MTELKLVQEATLLRLERRVPEPRVVSYAFVGPQLCPIIRYDSGQTRQVFPDGRVKLVRAS